MNDDEVKALLTLIEVSKQNELTGSIQLNWFKGSVGTVQVLQSYKPEALVSKYGE